MTTIDWPNDIPLPSSNLSGEGQASVIRTTMETGRTRQRNRFGTMANTYSVEWLFLADEYAAFMAFYQTTLKNGVLYFNLPLPETGTLDPVPVRFVEGRLTKSYVPHMQWRVTATVEAEIIQSVPDPEINIMPLLYPDVIDVTENMTLSMSHQNKLLRCLPGGGEIVITLPLNANFTKVFSCGFTKSGSGEVRFTGQPGVILESPNDYRRIFLANTPVTAAYTGANRFLLTGSMY